MVSILWGYIMIRKLDFTSRLYKFRSKTKMYNIDITQYKHFRFEKLFYVTLLKGGPWFWQDLQVWIFSTHHFILRTRIHYNNIWLPKPKPSLFMYFLCSKSYYHAFLIIIYKGVFSLVFGNFAALMLV